MDTLQTDRTNELGIYLNHITDNPQTPSHDCIVKLLLEHCSFKNPAKPKQHFVNVFLSNSKFIHICIFIK